MSKPTLTVEQMNEKFQVLTASVESIGSRLQEELTAGPAPAQTARLVAMALAKQAESMLGNVGGSLQYLNKPEQSDESDDSNPLGALVEVAEEVLESMVEQLGVEKEAIAPFLYEANGTMIPVIEDLVTRANGKLAEAEALTKAAQKK